MNKINRMISKYNFTPGNLSRIKYIVIHYVGALGGAKENCVYYGGGDRGSSAHYFVGFSGVWKKQNSAQIKTQAIAFLARKGKSCIRQPKFLIK